MARKKKTVTPEEINKETAKAVTEEVTEEVKAADEVAKEVTEEVEESAKPEIAEDVESEVIEEVAEAVDESAQPEATEMVEEAKTEDEAVEEAAEVNEVEDTDQTAEITENAAESVVEDATEEAVEEAEGESQETSTPTEFMNIEHFADYRKNDEPEAEKPVDDAEGDEPVEDKDTEAEPFIQDEIEEYREYENLTILDEIEEESNEPVVPTRVHKESKDALPYNPQKPRKVDVRFDFVELFVCMLVAVMLLSAFAFRHSVVDGGSMEDTLYDKEHLIITNLFYKPKQYDIIVCEDYTIGASLQKPIIKRVIATEGQTVRVVSMKEVYVDGVLVDTSFVCVDGEEDFPYNSIYPVECVVPEGEVFVMGDHRNSSLDSRVFGTIDEDSILGKVVLRFYPFDRFGKVE